MGILDNLRTAVFGQPLQVKEAPKVYVQGGMFSYNRRDNFKAYAKEGYQENAIVYHALMRSQTAASIPFKVYQGDIELERHPLNLRPKPNASGVEYFQGLYSYLLLSGTAMLLHQR